MCFYECYFENEVVCYTFNDCSSKRMLHCPHFGLKETNMTNIKLTQNFNNSRRNCRVCYMNTVKILPSQVIEPITYAFFRGIVNAPTTNASKLLEPIGAFMMLEFPAMTAFLKCSLKVVSFLFNRCWNGHMFALIIICFPRSKW